LSGPHVLVDGLVLKAPMGGALRYALGTLPRCASLLHARAGRLSVLLAESERDQGWVQALLSQEHLHVTFVDAPMHPALRRALRETHAVQKWIENSSQQGHPVHVVQTQSLPIPRLRFEGHQVHLCHGLRRQESGPVLVRQFATALLNKGVRDLHSLLAVSQTLTDNLQTRFADLPVQCAAPACDQRTRLPRNPDAGPFVLCPGPIVAHKNHALLVEAWGLDSRLPPLRLHAQQNPAARALQSRIQQLGLQERITWHAALDEDTWPAALATCAAVVLPSRLESFGMVALETLYAGAPLALSDLPSHQEVVGSARHAVAFFSSDNARQCAAAIQLAIDQSDAEPQNQRQRRSQDFAWNHTAQITVDHWCATLQ
jgi:glycosyltransferase involved in cell wall biosynthesis